MKRNNIFFYGIAGVTAFATILIVVINQLISNPVIAKTDILQRIQNVVSYTHETNLILELSQVHHLSDSYRDIQLAQLQKKAIKIYDLILSTQIDQNNEDLLKEFTTIVRDYIFLVEKIERTHSIEDYQIEKKELHELTNMLQELKKKYE